MEKTDKFIDPMDQLFAPPPNRTRWEAFKLFMYNSETGAVMGRTATNWAKLTTFYIIFYACLAALWAACMWGLLQTISDDRPTYQLDDSIIGSSPGLASRPLPPEGRDSVMSFNQTSGRWSNSEFPGLFGDFLQEYEDNTTGNACSFGGTNQLPCQVDTSTWEECAPEGTQLKANCLYFKINRVLEWTPRYYTDVNSLPSGMPDQLKQHIKDSPQNQREMVWLSCEGRHAKDKDAIGNLTYHPHQGFPGYYFPFRRQAHYKSPVVAVQFQNPTLDETIDVECRSWAPNIHQDRKEQLAVLNFKLRFN